MKIRKAENSDYQEVLRLYGDFVEDPKRYVDLKGDSFKKIIESSNSYLFLAEIEEEIVGFISCSIRDVIRYPKPILEVEEFYVRTENRRQGIGRTLMDHAINFAQAKDCQYVFLASAKERGEAHGFYKALGFDEYAYHYRRKP